MSETLSFFSNLVGCENLFHLSLADLDAAREQMGSDLLCVMLGVVNHCHQNLDHACQV